MKDICKDCNGVGAWYEFVSRGATDGKVQVWDAICNKCNGKGKLFWIDNIKRESNVKCTFMFDVYETMAENIIKEVIATKNKFRDPNNKVEAEEEIQRFKDRNPDSITPFLIARRHPRILREVETIITNEVAKDLVKEYFPGLAKRD